MNTKSLNELATNGLTFVTVARDETYMWSEDVQQKANGKIYGIYLVDLTQPTHLCELAVSYPATFLSNFFENVDAWRDENGEVNVELQDMEIGNGAEDDCYFSGYSVMDVRKEYTEADGDFESVFDYERGNPTVC